MWSQSGTERDMRGRAACREPALKDLAIRPLFRFLSSVHVTSSHNSLPRNATQSSSVSLLHPSPRILSNQHSPSSPGLNSNNNGETLIRYFQLRLIIMTGLFIPPCTWLLTKTHLSSFSTHLKEWTWGFLFFLNQRPPSHSHYICIYSNHFSFFLKDSRNF